MQNSLVDVDSMVTVKLNSSLWMQTAKRFTNSNLPLSVELFRDVYKRQVFFARRMLEIQAKAEYADVMELALYNGVLSGMALDGKSFFYVNPLEVLPEACHKDERKFHVKPIRQKWFGCACCPPNLARTVRYL